MKRIQKIKTHFRENKKTYFLCGGSITVGALGMLAISRSESDAQVVQKIHQIAWRPENNQTVVNLVERSTPSKPVHLEGTNLYFSSLNEAARETGHSLTRISKNVNGHIPDVNGDVFTLLEKAS